jgi:hypothetical protein
MKPMLSIRAPALCRFASVVSLAIASSPIVAQSEPEQMLRDGLRDWLVSMRESGALNGSQGEWMIEEPARRVVHLGILVDSASGARAADGLHVIGTTPGGNAERIGLRSGDVLLSVNGVSLVALGGAAGEGARAARVLKEQVDASASSAAIRFSVLRDGRTIEKSGTLTVTDVPAVRLHIGVGVGEASAADGADVSSSVGCGRVSIRDLAPRNEQLHAAAVTRIDGKSPGVSGQDTFRLSPGEHELEVGERIESRYLGFNERMRSAGQVYKRLKIVVEPDRTYFIAARIDTTQRNSWKDGAYWEPVVWKTASESCQ